MQNEIDDMEQMHLAGCRDAKAEDRIVGSFWFSIFCFLLGLACGLPLCGISRNRITIHQQGNTMTNTQARLEGSEDWNDYGDVALYEAVRREAIKASLSTFGLPEYEWLIEVRRENDNTIPQAMVRVRTSIVAEVVKPRCGAK